MDFSTIKIDKNFIRNIVESSLKAVITENMDIEEDANPAYDRKNATSNSNLADIWAAIDKQQKHLQDLVFGELSEKLHDITQEKLKLMGDEYLSIPEVVCRAGNDKLPENVLIINMSSSLMCPSFYLGLCTIRKGACYAQRAENQYTKNVLPQRWKTDLMHTQMLQQYENGNKEPMKVYFRLIEKYIQLGNAYAVNSYKKELKQLEHRKGTNLSKEEKRFLLWQHQCKYRISDVRLNETGDFHCQLAVKLWDEFAKKIKQKYGISTHAYTARNLDFSQASKNIAINPSHTGINLGEEIKPRYFNAVSDAVYDKLPDVKLGDNHQPILKFNKEKNKYYYKCPCGKGESKCNMCGVCFTPNETGKEYTIFVRYHGVKNATGLKKLFKTSEIQNVMKSLEDHGWTTPGENKIYNSKSTKNAMAKLDANVDRLRKNSRQSKK